MTIDRGEREEAILSRLAEEGGLTVTSLATDLGVSEVTIRTDLRSLEDQGMLVRTRGGARPSTLKHILQRQKINVEAKERIAAAAAGLVTDDDTVMIEAGTTTALIVRFLAGRRGVQIVTNSTLVFSNARLNPALNIILTGGVFRRDSESLVGPIAERSIGDFNTRIAFLGTDGFSPERGLTTRFVEGGQVATMMRDRAEETWLVADSSKFGQAGFVTFLPLAGITGIITDSLISDEAAQSLNEHTQLRVV
ncbi:DeoR/GlpR family DNA-binding transcription regulator [Tessaracoccus antarcticus]|uniref:DeoR/GlpR transcriptional regulator n=1 Tax=Tessaracoccus antarcticus TaxID=2479848 RepID=A0A3M0GL26_9ACTN|nr:DeoR/GlpR family DNA-binding transcription regulator [Tessaracoccus antarcticus]RMB61849.1 DeoR/GlpR transcriptional regulator [Tessaracoccus antarcticus]